VSRFYSNKFIASLAITALTLTGGLSPVVAMASDVQIKSTYNVQSTQSLVNTLTRLGGYDRYGTAVQIADYGWQSASTAVLAPSSDLNMVDALASSSLAKAVDGPILLSDNDSVPSDTMNELKKLGVKKVYMVSGTAVISAKVESDLSAAGIQTVRLGGYDRYETAVNIAKEIQAIKPFQEVVVTNAFANVDAISIAPIAAAKGIPVLLVDKDSVPTVVSDFINSSGINKTYVIGGTAVVSDSVKDEFPNALRLGGNDRFDTNTEVLKEFKNLIAGGKMFFANGNDTSLIDSLAGAPMVAKVRGAIVLANKESVPDGTKGFIETNIALKNPGILGGTAVILDSTVQSLGYTQPGQSNNLDGALELNTLNATFEDKTVNGNILINADGVTLKNVVVKGTIFVDPGKDGSATLDSVQADRIVVLSGAELSIYLKETTSDSLVVSSSSNVRVVAETGTTLGSTLVQSNANVESQNGADIGALAAQSLGETPINIQLQGTFSNEVSLSGSIKLTAADGTIVPSLNVTGASAPDSIQLAGNFPSVSIIDNSSVTVLAGKIEKLETKGTSEIVVKSGAEITKLSSVTGDIKVSGGGTVEGKTTTDTPTELGDISSTPVVDRDRDRDRDVIQKTEQPVISGTVRAGDTTISGTSEAGATISIKNNETEFGTAIADGTGNYTVTLNDGVNLAKDEVLSIIAKAPNKSISEAVSVTVAAAQTTQPKVMGTVGAGEKMIMGIAEAGATVSVKRSGDEIGTATADKTGSYMMKLNDGVTLVEADVLLITATAPDKVESNAVSITVAAALAPTTTPTVVGTVRAGDNMISGTTDADAFVCVMRDETMIGKATADGTGAYTVTLKDGVTLVKDEVLAIVAKAPDKSMSEAVSVTVAAAQTTQPTVMGTVGAGEKMIMGTAEAGATVSVKKSGDEIGTATADETGSYIVKLNDGVTLVEADVLSITVTASDKVESNAVSVTVAAALAPTTSPEVEGTVMAGDKIISGTTDAAAFVCIMRDGTVIGTTTADETGAYTVTLKDSVTLVKDEVLAIIAKAPDKSISATLSVTVAAALVEIIEPTETEVTADATDAEVTTEVAEAEMTAETTETDVIAEAIDAEVTTEVAEAEMTAETTETDVIAEAIDAEVTTEVVEAEITAETTETEVMAEVIDAEVTTGADEVQ